MAKLKKEDFSLKDALHEKRQKFKQFFPPKAPAEKEKPVLFYLFGFCFGATWGAILGFYLKTAYWNMQLSFLSTAAVNFLPLSVAAFAALSITFAFWFVMRPGPLNPRPISPKLPAAAWHILFEMRVLIKHDKTLTKASNTSANEKPANEESADLSFKYSNDKGRHFTKRMLKTLHPSPQFITPENTQLLFYLNARASDHKIEEIHDLCKAIHDENLSTPDQFAERATTIVSDYLAKNPSLGK